MDNKEISGKDEKDKDTEIKEIAERDLTALFEQVEKTLKKGITRLEIKQELLDQGWTSEEVDKAFIKHDVERLTRIAELLEKQFVLLKNARFKAEKAAPEQKKKPKRKKKRIIASKNTKKYHQPGCRFVEMIKTKDMKRFGDEKEAETEGYNPCHTCCKGRKRIVASRNTGKYHLPGCRFISNIKQKDRERFYEEKEAIKAGYEPCRACNDVIVIEKKTEKRSKAKPKKHYHHRYVASSDGGHFHTYACHWGKAIEKKKQRFYPSMAAARRAGLKPCDECIGKAKTSNKTKKKLSRNGSSRKDSSSAKKAKGAHSKNPASGRRKTRR
ncbi:hypothetical protein GF351_01220 [Candidatus Woesearchaeota archaeon]|nr:hypothetical protein [Candidatus Woesearchaeota archaeon]